MRKMRAISSPRLLRFTSALTPEDRATIDRVKAEVVDQQEEAPGAANSWGGRKRRLVGFSKQSRLSLARDLAQITTPDTPYHLTLTYGELSPVSRDELSAEKQALDVEGSRRGLYGYWTLEFQRARVDLVNEWNGRPPHWHLLVWGTRDQVDSFERWFRKRWNNQEEHAVDVREGDAAKAAWYLAMHAQKDDQVIAAPVGRWWGRINRREVARHREASLAALDVQPREVIWAKRIMRRMTGSRGSLGEQGFGWFVPEREHGRILAVVSALALRPRCVHREARLVLEREGGFRVDVKHPNHPF